MEKLSGVSSSLRRVLKSLADLFVLWGIAENSGSFLEVRKQPLCNVNMTSCRPIRSVIIRVMNKIGRPRSGSQICLITKSKYRDKNYVTQVRPTSLWLLLGWCSGLRSDSNNKTASVRLDGSTQVSSNTENSHNPPIKPNISRRWPFCFRNRFQAWWYEKTRENIYLNTSKMLYGWHGKSTNWQNITYVVQTGDELFPELPSAVS